MMGKDQKVVVAEAATSEVVVPAVGGNTATAPPAPGDVVQIQLRPDVWRPAVVVDFDPKSGAVEAHVFLRRREDTDEFNRDGNLLWVERVRHHEEAPLGDKYAWKK